jgi:histidine triad (HIT) family protein
MRRRRAEQRGAAHAGDVRDGCVFCAIVAGGAPAERVFEDDTTMAFLDINPAADGHTLVIPKRHAENLFDLGEEDGEAVWRTVRHVATGIREALGSEGMNLFQSNGRAAFQAVLHFHVHVVPRWSGDGIRLPWIPRPGDTAHMAEVAGRLRSAL